MKPYQSLALSTLLNIPIMFAVTYVMVNSGHDIYFNLNRLYMAGMMVAPMVVVKLIVMRNMFPNNWLNAALAGIAVLVFGALFIFARRQSFIGNSQFLRSMIPHHSSAIVMCQEADIKNEEIKDLCSSIIESQQREIDQMKDILQRISPSI
jgi:hypothetical protein